MIITCSGRSQSDQALVSAFRSLRVADAEVIARIADRSGRAWTVQICDDYNGYLFVLVEPVVDQAEQLPSYMITGQTGEIELAIVDCDDCRTLGHFRNINEVAAELSSRICPAADRDLYVGVISLI